MGLHRIITFIHLFLYLVATTATLHQVFAIPNLVRTNREFPLRVFAGVIFLEDQRFGLSPVRIVLYV